MTRHVAELPGLVGAELGVTDWQLIDQHRVDLFAEATGDHQWIHVDRERAAAGPFGTTIAHGYLTLSMLSLFLDPFLELEGVAMQLNYGVDRVRFPHPVRTGSRIRCRVGVESVEATTNGLRLVLKCVVEIEGVDKPACVAFPVAMVVPEEAA